MSSNSNIEWTDATWNPVRGCVKVSPGCANCYAETFAERFRGVPGHSYEQGFDLRLVPEKLAEPLTWKKPRRVFVNSMSDLFQDGVPDSYIDQVFAVMALAPQHTFQVLTKRADRMAAYLGPGQFRDVRVCDVARRIAEEQRLKIADVRQLWIRGSESTIPRWPLPNVWLGVSVENQHFADERIPLLLRTPAAVRFISAEPLLEKILLDNGDTSWLSCTSHTQAREGADCCTNNLEGRPHFSGVDWVIVGGESGPGARLFDVFWARQIVQQCQAAGVPCFVKQLGANAYDSDRTASGRSEVLHLKSQKGGDPSEWPADLRVREFPLVEVPA